MKGKNYLEIEKFSLWFYYFCFIDVSEYLADEIFIRHKVRVWFQHEYGKEGSDYLIILCKVKKKDRAEFISAMKELESKMLLMGYNDYSVFCEKLLNKVNDIR